MTPPTIHLYTGKLFNLLRPRPRDVDIESIAHSLSQITRWTGQCPEPFSVGQHCCMCADLAPQEHKLAALMHDAHESLTNDCARPLKALLPRYQEIAGKIERMLAVKYRLPYPEPGLIKEIDLRMQATEGRQFFPKGDWSHYPVAPFDITIKVWPHKRAEREFLRRFHRLYRRR